MNKYPHVMAPIRIRGQLIKNRIISGPTTLHTASNGELWPTEEVMEYFEDRARAGCGIVTVTGVSAQPAADNGHTTSWDLYQKNHCHRLAQLARRIHFYGAKAYMELIGIFPEGYTVCDGCSIMGGPGGREITREAMEQYKKDCAFAGAKLKELGYNGILFHFGHSVPVAQFLSPLTNRRTDEYGGSTENRCRYPIEILEAVRAAVGNEMIFEVRISGNEVEEGGIDLEEGLKIGKLLAPHCDVLQCSAGMHNDRYMTVLHPCGFLPPMPNVYIAEAFKKSGLEIPVTAIGAIPDLEAAEDIIASGKADFVTITRALIADPDMPKKCLEGRAEDVRPCVKCMRCHDSSGDGYHFRCTVNPEVGIQHEVSRMVTPPERQKKVAVIGGGPAGMEAAVTAAKRGHQVTLFEKEAQLGGKLTYAGLVSFKYPLANYLEWQKKQVEKAGVTVKLGVEATPDTVSGFDSVIVAIGSVPFIPPIEGAEKAMTALEVYGHEAALGSTVAVIGGGQVGCETALHLAMLGHQVTLLEMRSSLAPDALPTARNELIFEIEKNPNVTVVTGLACKKIDHKGVYCESDTASSFIEAESVILCSGMRGKWQEADSFFGCAPEFAEVGDCVKARNVGEAVLEGWSAAVRL